MGGTLGSLGSLGATMLERDAGVEAILAADDRLADEIVGAS